MSKKINFNLFSTKYFCIVAFPGSNQGWKGIWGIQERSQRRELKSSQKYKVPESKTQANSEKMVNAIMQTQKGSEMTGLQATVTPRGSGAATRRVGNLPDEKVFFYSALVLVKFSQHMKNTFPNMQTWSLFHLHKERKSQAPAFPDPRRQEHSGELTLELFLS